MSAEQTWNRIRPILSDHGITRVGDITGLDRIGIPVWIAVRPNARTLSVSQGKGLDEFAAKVSAAMEALELAHAERTDLPLVHDTVSGMAATGDIIDVGALPRVRATLLGTKSAIPWTRATNWTTGASVWVPYELVNMDATVPRMHGGGAFLHSSNGLASGNVIEEAVLHALCEVIERDAMALWKHATPTTWAARRLDPLSVESPVARRLFDQLRSADIRPMVSDATTDIGVATIRVELHDMTADPVTRPLPASVGSGCHPDPTIALCRAVTEAAQSRLTMIAGSRDDIGRDLYRLNAAANQSSALRDHAGTRPFASVPGCATSSVLGDLAQVLARLASAGLDRVFVVDLGKPAMPVSVVRVLVPGLEGFSDAPSYLPGRRIRSRLPREAAS